MPGIIGVVVLTFHSADVIAACLDSLAASRGAELRIAVCDNKSQDSTVDIVRGWAEARGLDLTEIQPGGESPAARGSLTLIHTGGNLGFAGGVNVGLRYLLEDPEVDLFWILNPDGEATPETAAAYLRRAEEVGPFSLMGGRTRYHEAPRHIQTDGGRVDYWSGVCRNVNLGMAPEEATFPEAGSLDFIAGANMVASRAFLERAGLMVEDYFLYYEEVDWAARRGALPLAVCPEAEVIHHGGTSIGTGRLTRRPSPFANYFNYRNRMRFMRRVRPFALPATWGLSMLRVARLVLYGAWDEAWAAFAGLSGLRPPAAVRERIAPEDRALAFEFRDRTR